MDYEKLYKEVLERLRTLVNSAKKKGHIIVRTEDIEDTFPELKENEDERIRRELIDAIQGLYDYDELPLSLTTKRKDEWIAWLEKQESVGEIVERCKTSWYNEGKIQGQIEGLSDDEKYQQGWHDALEKERKEVRNDKRNKTRG